MTQNNVTTFMEALRKEIGEPCNKKVSPLTLYVESNIEGIKQALKEGYTTPQLTKLINKNISKQYGVNSVYNAIKKIIGSTAPAAPKIQQANAGFFFTYTVDNIDKNGWVPGKQNDVDNFIQKVKKLKPAALVILTSQKPMTKNEWNKQRGG